MRQDKQDIEVSDDNIFLQLLTEKHQITPKRLAMYTGRAVSTIYKYLGGELTIPSIIWRTIFERTLDVTIFNLITADIPCSIAPLVSAMGKLDKTTFESIIAMRQKQIKVEQYVLQILTNNEFDKSDITTIAHYKLAFPDMVSAQAQIYQAVIGEHYGEVPNARE